MEFTTLMIKIACLIPEACRNAGKLPAALITSGIVQAAAALALVVFRSPAGIFSHGKAPFYLYYGILASVGFYVSSDLTRRGAIGMTILWISILPIVLVAGLGGFVILK
uniref:Uncharacterized protein n=1 Tax=Setaria italica TaxID=4555 RepID=K4AIC6_SETIT